MAVLDPRERRVVLARDGMGIRPLDYRRTPTSLAFGSEIKTLLADPDVQARPNDQLLAELLLRRTHRRPVRRLNVVRRHSSTAGPCRRLHGRTRDLHRYWDFDPRRPEGTQSFDEYAEAFRHHFQRAVKRRLRSAHPVAITVSGGLDSSAIFCVAPLAQVPLVGLTYTSRDGGTSDESAFVTEVELACSRPIRYVDTPAEGPLFRSADMIRTVEAPMLNGQWFRGDRLMNAVTAAGAGTLLTGHWGDEILFDQAYLVDLLRAGAWRTISMHLNEYPRWFPDAAAASLLPISDPTFSSTLFPDGCAARSAPRSAACGTAPWDDWYCEPFRREARPDVFAHASGATARARALYRECARSIMTSAWIGTPRSRQGTGLLGRFHSSTATSSNF